MVLINGIYSLKILTFNIKLSKQKEYKKALKYC